MRCTAQAEQRCQEISQNMSWGRSSSFNPDKRFLCCCPWVPPSILLCLDAAQHTACQAGTLQLPTCTSTVCLVEAHRASDNRESTPPPQDLLLACMA